MILDNRKRVHFVGIGGIGMSGIAQVLLEMGYKVSGSDLKLNNLTKKIESSGGRIFEGHRASNLLKNSEVLVYSSSISPDNPELEEARRRKLKIVHRAEILGELFNKKNGVAITGTHGKTTTTSLVSIILKEAKLDPTVMIGGEVSQFKGNARFGKGEYLVAEADESDSSFLNLNPLYGIVTNIEMEHVDHYKTLDDAKASYRAFIGNVKKGGTVFYNCDDPNAVSILKDFNGNSKAFGFSKHADIYPVDIKMAGFKTSFGCVYNDKLLGTVSLSLAGRHNVLNALAAILVGLEIGLKFNDIVNAIKGFSGAKRRFQLRATRGGVMLIDDYAHHPTEIRAVLGACRNWKNKRIIVIFQPHRYTRTKFLADDFGRCFKGADKLILTDIYSASEKPIRGVSIKNIYDRVRKNGLHDTVIVKKDSIAEYVMRLKNCGDIILVLGAGDIKEVADELSAILKGGRKGKDRTFSKTTYMDKDLVDKFKRTIKGRLATGENLSHHTSFKIGGPADMWVEPRDVINLKRALVFANLNKISVFVIGNGTNLLASDSGFNGMLIHLGSSYFKGLKIDGQSVKVGAGFSLSKLVRVSCEKGLGGVESLIGIPGTVGGAIYMNAGGSTNPIYKNIGDLVESLKVMDYTGKIRFLKKKDLKFEYRRSNLRPYIILEASLKLKKSDKAVLMPSASRFLKMKREKQPLDMPSAGCVFKNPEDSQFTCGQMIDMLGLKGKKSGGAEISGKHANFIVNSKGASCKDVLGLVEFIKEKVRVSYKVDLELEIKVI